MTKYLLMVDYQPGVVDKPMDEWKPEEIKAHMDYYACAEQGADRRAANWSTARRSPGPNWPRW